MGRKSLKRREDPELLTGRGRYVADIVRPGMLHAAFVRSPLAYARIGSIDISAAITIPGVHAVLTAADFPEGLGAQPCTHLFAGQHDTPYYALAKDRVRYVGEPVAIVVADSPHVAEDGVEEVEVDWDPLGAVSSVQAALADGAPLLYDDWGDNVAAVFEQEKGDVDAAFAAADVVVTEQVRIQRQFGCSLETRGVVAEWDEFADELTLWSSTQVLHILRDLLSDVLGLPEHRIRIIVPRIGGAFGAKFHFYPEETAVALAARATGRPVRWIEDRLESFVATVHAREQVIEATMAATNDGTITAVKADILGDMGAALHTVGYGPVWLTAVMMTNLYAIENIRARAQAIMTNKTPLGSYRGGDSRRRTSRSSARSTSLRASSGSTASSCGAGISSRQTPFRIRASTTYSTAGATPTPSTRRSSSSTWTGGVGVSVSCASRGGTSGSGSRATSRTRR